MQPLAHPALRATLAQEPAWRATAPRPHFLPCRQTVRSLSPALGPARRHILGNCSRHGSTSHIPVVVYHRASIFSLKIVPGGTLPSAD